MDVQRGDVFRLMFSNNDDRSSEVLFVYRLLVVARRDNTGRINVDRARLDGLLGNTRLLVRHHVMEQ